MKIYKKIALFGLAAMGVASCSNSEENGVDLTPPSEGNSWASFVINLPKKSNMYAVRTDHGTEEGTTEEQKIKDVRIVLYDKGQTQVRYALDYAITTDGNNNVEGDVSSTVSKSKFVTKAKKVKKDNYYALVLINPKQKVKDLTNPGRNLLDFNQAAKLEADYLMKDGFFMSNDQGLVFLSENRLKKDEAAAEAIGVALPVKVDRAVAKIFVDSKNGVTTAEGSKDKVSNFSWTLDVTNTKTFWMRNIASIAQEDGSDGTAEVVADPDNSSINSTPRLLRYATDPNFDQFFTTPEAKKEFNYLPESLEGHDMKNFKEHLYALENTMAKDKQMQNQTTRVILKATYTPEGLNEGDDWLSYLGIRMGLVDFTKAFILAVTDQPIEGSNLPTSFRDDMKKVQTEGLVTLDQVGVGEEQTITMADKSFVSNNLKFYKEGINYFPILIRHFEDDIVPVLNGYGRYGIVRNNVYKLDIQKIKTPGEPIVPPIDPEDPDDKENVYVGFDVEVLPWVIREQGVIIE